MLKQIGNTVVRRQEKEILQIEPWGRNSFRVRATQCQKITEEPWSALERQPDCDCNIEMNGKSATLTNGKIRCELMVTGKMKFYNQKGELLLEEFDRNRFRSDIKGEFNSALEIDPRMFDPIPNTDNYKLTVRFEPRDGEKIYGMGQYQQPYLDLKHCQLELAHRNSQASIPFALSSMGYGFLWNNPAIGTATFGKNVTEWVAHSTKGMDYWITAGDTPAEIEEAYANVTGKVPMMPDYGMGFWQCKLRYQTQDEIMEVARGYKERGIPVDVIVCDYFHWPNQGDWKFDPDYWPQPEKMVKELKDMGMELMVSVWPTVEEGSENYQEIKEEGFLIRTEHGKNTNILGDAAIFDATNPDARQYVWNKIKKNYYDKGIQVFWLDEAEPEFTGYEFSHFRYFQGANMEIGNIYPKEYARMAYEGMEAEGQQNILNLLRCAWVGSQKYGALVWSGDIDSSFRSLRNQLAAGLNMGISGIPWWTTDIGGFHGGNIYDDDFKEVLVRWFQFGAFCPVMRLHGYREPIKKPLGTTGGGKNDSGAENEIWSYGEEVYEICKKYILLREKMRPYVKELMKAAHEQGSPVIRPMFYDFPEDQKCWDIGEQYMFGPDILVAPVMEAKEETKEVYLPAGAIWTNAWTKEIWKGGQTVTVRTPIDQIPLFTREGYTLEVHEV